MSTDGPSMGRLPSHARPSEPGPMPSIARFALVSALLALGVGTAGAADPFLTKPSLQLGDAPASGDLALLWHSDDVAADWSVEARVGASSSWSPAGPPT